MTICQRKYTLLYMLWILSTNNNIMRNVLKDRLIFFLTFVEQNNELLIENHETWPTRSIPFYEVNIVKSHDFKRDS